MKNKSLLLKLWLIAMAVGGFGLSFSSAVTLKLSGLTGLEAVNQKAIEDKIIQIHFADNWNNFGWFIYYDNIDETEETNSTEGSYHFEVGVAWDRFICKLQLKWFYYNAERWERLWPLDEKTERNRNINSQITWWIYTACAVSWYNEALEQCSQKDGDAAKCQADVKIKYQADNNGYYGSVGHNYSGKNMNFIIWVSYQTGTNGEFIKINKDTKLFASFIRLGNKYPVGFVYDYNGWVGLAWCHIENGKLSDDTMSKLIGELNKEWEIGNMFKKSENSDKKVEYIWKAVTGIDCSSISTEDTMSKVVIEWIVWASDKWSDYGTIFTQMGNQSDQKMQYFTTANVDNDTLMNYARKKAEILCRWKWQNKFENINRWKGKVICINGEDREHITADEAEQIKNVGKTLIIKNWSVTIKPMTQTDMETKKYYDIFIDNGNLKIQENNENIASGTNEELFIFTKEWFISGENHSYSGFNEALSGAGIYDNKYSWNDIAVWAYIRWNFIVNGNVEGIGEEGKLKHKYFIYWKFSTLDWFKDLEKTFSWRCHNQISNEEYKFFCPKIDWNPYVNAALVIIDQNYPSTFFND